MAKNAVAASLQQGLVDLIELSLQAKQVHWNIQGEGFYALHRFLDKLTDQARDAYDEFAERLVTLGIPADGRAATVAKTTALKPVAEGAITVAKGYALMEEAVIKVADSLKESIGKVEDDDPLTADLLTSTAFELEKTAWMLRMQGK